MNAYEYANRHSLAPKYEHKMILNIFLFCSVWCQDIFLYSGRFKYDLNTTTQKYFTL